MTLPGLIWRNEALVDHLLVGASGAAAIAGLNLRRKSITRCTIAHRLMQKLEVGTIQPRSHVRQRTTTARKAIVMIIAPPLAATPKSMKWWCDLVFARRNIGGFNAARFDVRLAQVRRLLFIS